MQKKPVESIDFFYELDQALRSSSFDQVEYLRGFVKIDHAQELTEIYESENDWVKKELLIHLVQDQMSDDFSVILEDAIHAPSAESRAYSICYREKDRGLLNKYVNDYVVVPELVEKDIKKYLKTKMWWQFWR